MSFINDIVREIEIVQKAIIKNDIEKAWKKHPIGTVITRKDGRKYRKVSETGNSDKDWQLVTKDKFKPEEDTKERTKNGEQGGSEVNKKDLPEQAKNTSEQALHNAIKQSPDPEVRQAAHEELGRREKEEKPQEEEKKDDKDRDEESIYGNSKISTLEIIDSLNKQYKGKGVNFSITSEGTSNQDYNSVGISYAALLSNGSIEIYLLDDAYDRFEENEKKYGKSFEQYFKEVVESIIRHEEVHKKYGDNPEDPEDEIAYLSNKNEIKAQAQSIVDDYRRKNYRDEDIRNLLEENDLGESDHYYKYTDLFDYDDKVYRDLKKEIISILGKKI